MKIQYGRKGTTWDWCIEEDNGMVLAHGVDHFPNEEECLALVNRIKEELPGEMTEIK